MTKIKGIKATMENGAVREEEIERDLGEIPTGKEQPFEGSKKVVSEISMQRQYIPEDAEYFKDMISDEVEKVSQE